MSYYTVRQRSVRRTPFGREAFCVSDSDYSVSRAFPRHILTAFGGEEGGVRRVASDRVKYLQFALCC